MFCCLEDIFCVHCLGVLLTMCYACTSNLTNIRSLLLFSFISFRVCLFLICVASGLFIVLTLILFPLSWADVEVACPMAKNSR